MWGVRVGGEVLGLVGRDEEAKEDGWSSEGWVGGWMDVCTM